MYQPFWVLEWSPRENFGPRSMSSDVSLGMVSIYSPLLAWVLSSSSNPGMLVVSLTTLS